MLNDKSPFELPTERLASTEQSGKRKYIYPAKYSGSIKKFRGYFFPILILIFLMLPWLKVAGHQAILLDIPNRKFAIFGLTFWAHETPILFFVLISFLLLMGLVTSLYGRIWCGWTCPQTVFIEGIFRKIENLIEGFGLAQERYNNKPLSISKVIKKLFKWCLYVFFAILISHSFLAYFVGAPEIIKMVQNSPTQNFGVFIAALLATIITLFDFAWFREQFCIIACPYGRFQSVLMDEDSKVVLYDKHRGEPRKKDSHDTDFKGDCINCYRCVQVCPTGIDIRRGTQMECIMCTACIDACNTVMTKINKPKGLIRYTSENKATLKKSSKFKIRSFIYAGLLVAAIVSLVIVVSNRNMTPIHIKRTTNPPYQLTQDGLVRNQYAITVHNQYFYESTFSFNIKNENKIKLIVPVKEIVIPEGKSKIYTAFIDFDPNLLVNGKVTLDLEMHVKNNKKNYRKVEEVLLVGPLN